MSQWYVDGWQCDRCTLVNINEHSECAACLHPKPPPPETTQSNEEETETNNESIQNSNNPYCFNECGDALRISGHDNNTITFYEALDSQWATCYGKFNMDINKNNFKIYLLINSITQPDGICIGICSSDQNALNSYFHFKIDGCNNYGYKSDGKSFCNGTKVGRSGSGYKSGDILTISIENKNISWLVNDIARCIQRDINYNISYKLAISMSINNVNNSITMLNIEQSENKNKNNFNSDEKELEYNNNKSALYQRRMMRNLGVIVMTAGDFWYGINKKWYDKWKEYTMFNKTDDDIPGGIQYLDSNTNMHPPGPIDNTDLIENDPNIRNTVFGFIHKIQQLFPIQSLFHIIPTAVKQICLSFYASPQLKKDITEHITHEWIHEQMWEYLFNWYGGGPTIERKVYERGGLYSREQYICIYPRFIPVIYCDGKTGEIDYRNCETRAVPPDFTLKQFALELEDDIETDNMDDIPYIHFWFPFERIKEVYLIDKQKAKVTEDDLKSVDPERLIEMPDDFLKTRLEDVLLNDDDMLMVERKQEDGTWPRQNLIKYDNNWKNDIKVGDILDCKDDQDKWYESFVRYVFPKEHEKYSGHIIVHYIGWNIKWDLPVEVNEDNVAKRNTKTSGPHRPRRRQRNAYGGYAGY